MLHEENTPDDELITRILAGETRSFEQIIRRYNSCLYKTGRAYGFSHADTEDLMQETYVSVFTHLGQFRYQSTLKTWMIRIMLNQCYHKTRKQSFRRERAELPLMDKKSAPMFHYHTTGTDEPVVNEELKHELEDAVGRIPADYRMVFTLREMNGLSVRETAGALAISEGNVKTKLNRAKKMLRTEIRKRYSLQDIYEFNLIYCDAMVERVMTRIHQVVGEKQDLVSN
jgi:RNA polymerase sigma-70 factor (ECF subfamily)